MGKKPKSSSKPKEGSIELRNKTQKGPNRKMKCEGKGDKSTLHFKVLKGKNANNQEKDRTQRGRPTHNSTLNRLLLHHSMLGHFVSEWAGWCPTWGSLEDSFRAAEGCACWLDSVLSISTHTKGRIRMRSHPSLSSLPQLFRSYDGTQHCPGAEMGP